MNKFCFFIIVFVFFSCNNNNQQLNKGNLLQYSSKTTLHDVETRIIKNKKFQKQITANGKIVAQNQSEMRFKIYERISSVKVKNGQRVKKGQLLAILDNEILKNNLEKAQIELKKAKIKLEEEKINYSLDLNYNEDVESNKLQILKIKSGYLEAENEFKKADLLYRQTYLEAPFDGVVANLIKKNGDFIGQSDAFCVIIDPKTLDVVFYVTEGELSFIEKNQLITINSFTDKSKNYGGFISEINPLVDENGLIQIKAKLNNVVADLFSGMNVRVIVSKNVDGALVVPKESIVIRSNKEIVFTYKNGLANWNYVQVLDENGLEVAIKSDLQVGDTIITAGNLNLSHDTKVNAVFLNN